MDIHDICLNCFLVKGDYEVCPHCGFIEGTLPREPYLLYPGTLLAERYLVGTVLGTGGFGVTYKAWDNKLSIIVAVKEFYPAGLVNRIPGERTIMVFSGEKQQNFIQQLGRFMEEAKNMAKFAGDKNIVNVFDFFQENQTAYIVMEYLDGMTLKEYINESGGRIPEEEALCLSEGLFEAVKSIHSKGILHRDISPDNIFILKDRRIKVLDFGAARFTDNENAELAQAAVIKMGYAPIEQYRSNMKQGVWTDIYAVGATLYKMLTGVTPEESVDRVEKDILKRPSMQGISISSYTERAIMKAMAVKPELRFKSMEQMQEAIEKGIHVDFPEEELRKKKLFRIAIVGLSVLAFLLMGSYVGYESTRPSAETLAGMEISAGYVTMSLNSDQETYALYEKLAEGFREQYPRYEIKLTDGDEGILFPYRSPDKKADLTLLIDSLDVNAYWFLDSYEKYFPDEDGIPLGFDIAAVYADSLAFRDAGIKIPGVLKSEEELIQLQDSVGGGACFPDWGTRLRDVQKQWPGYYEVIPAERNGKTVGIFREIWSIREDAEEQEKAIAMLFLHFCLSEYGQNLLHVQSDTAFPIHKNTWETYLEINRDFSYLSKQMKQLDMEEGRQTEEGINVWK